MRAGNFIKKHRFDIIITCSVFAFLWGVYLNTHLLSIAIVALYIFGYTIDNKGSQNNVTERKNQIPKGLVLEDLKNIAFVKNWHETRKKGLVKFSLINGGVFFGFVLCFAFSILCLMLLKGIVHYISVAPTNMFNFIGYTYIAGIICGTILYRFLWLYNEKRFIRLTDPFSIQFES